MRSYPLFLLLLFILFQGCPARRGEMAASRYNLQPGGSIRFYVRGRMEVNSGFPFGRFLFRVSSGFTLENRSWKPDMMEIRLKPERLFLYRRGRRQRLPGFVKKVLFRRPLVFITSPGGTPLLFKRTGDHRFVEPAALSGLLLDLILPAIDRPPARFPQFTIPWRGRNIRISPESSWKEEASRNRLLRERTMTIRNLHLKPLLFHDLFLQSKSIFQTAKGLPGGCTITGRGSGKMQALLSLPFTVVLKLTVTPTRPYSRLIRH